MKALTGLRMLDLTHMVSGPYAGLMLADLGVETIKVEPPETGEMTRQLYATDPKNSRHGMGAFFLSVNRNKKSMTLNLKAEAGLALFYELVKVSDIVLNNFSVGVTDRLRISYPYLSDVNPRIITCSISGFGETGPGKHWPAYDMVAQAMSGVMSITGHPGSPPTRLGYPVADVSCGLMGVIGILSAVIARQTTGRGQHVDVAMLDSQISMLTYMATMHLLSGEIPQAIGNAHELHVPYDTFPCQDGYIILAVVTDEFWENLMRVVPTPDLNTEENRRRAGRRHNRDIINVRLAETFRTDTQAAWIERLRTARIPCAPVLNFAQALNNPQVEARRMVVEVADPQGDPVRVPGNPVKLSHTYEDTFTPPPLLGQDTDEVLRNLLGMSVAEIEALRVVGVI